MEMSPTRRATRRHECRCPGRYSGAEWAPGFLSDFVSESCRFIAAYIFMHRRSVALYAWLWLTAGGGRLRYRRVTEDTTHSQRSPRFWRVVVGFETAPAPVDDSCWLTVHALDRENSGKPDAGKPHVRFEQAEAAGSRASATRLKISGPAGVGVVAGQRSANRGDFSQLPGFLRSTKPPAYSARRAANRELAANRLGSGGKAGRAWWRGACAPESFESRNPAPGLFVCFGHGRDRSGPGAIAAGSRRSRASL
jgi:hypothetical protein